MDFLNKNVLVIGIGRSGTASAEKLKELGSSVLLVDSRETEANKEKAKKLEGLGIVVKLGEHSLDFLKDRDLIIVSPGVPNDLDLLIKARKKKIPVMSEIELASKFITSPIIGITGTNGKTTTTVLTGKVFEEAGILHQIAGNIGFPLVKCNDKDFNHWFIVEISSFQLENIIDFKPKIAVLLNITEDHLDRHYTFDEYMWSKNRIFMNQTPDDFSILNYDDQFIRKLSSKIQSQIIFFSKSPISEKGVYVEEGKIIGNFKGKFSICDLKDLPLKGDHNLENYLAVAAICLTAKISCDSIRKAFVNFKGLEHRLEFVGNFNGIDYYNDSKSTNPDSTIKALTAFTQPIILLLGGRNKGNSFKYLAECLNDRVKGVVLFGESKREIEDALRDKSIIVKTTDSFEDAVLESRNLAKEGDIVLFSPACASFDMFLNYEERGRAFKDIVKSLKVKI
ncbi:MAG: UDP-N-acetylmuramoyl-L-alanine--D-glutamate ligase [Actinobacteria bacterium]|nr:UDP-N-acetylmuramoyl-L-alanine--D-glutamate ligase [Actinomycetota bacterium]